MALDPTGTWCYWFKHNLKLTCSCLLSHTISLLIYNSYQIAKYILSRYSSKHGNDTSSPSESAPCYVDIRANFTVWAPDTVSLPGTPQYVRSPSRLLAVVIPPITHADLVLWGQQRYTALTVYLSNTITYFRQNHFSYADSWRLVGWKLSVQEAASRATLAQCQI